MTASPGEFELIESIRRRIPSHPLVELGIGDDAACLAPGDPGRLVTTDMLLEGVHFLIPPATPRQVAFKAINVNLSDIAAMGGTPTAAFVSIAWPRSRGSAFQNEFCRGLEEACSLFHVSLAGGDTNSWDARLVVSVTVLGRLEGPPWKRSGAQPGDWIFVTGSLGGSLAGHHLDFIPRVRESQELRRTVSPTSMIDVSDGFTADLYHILEESRVGAIVHEEAIPVAPAAHESRDSKTPLEHALGDGEDFELLFTVSPADGERLLRSPPFESPLSHVGEITSEPAAILRRKTGKDIPLPRLGWTHRLIPD